MADKVRIPDVIKTKIKSPIKSPMKSPMKDKYVGDKTPVDLNNILLPPPFIRRTEALDDALGQNLPGEYELSKSGQLLLNYLTYGGFVNDQIAHYNNFIQTEMLNIMRSRPIVLPNDLLFRISEVRIVPPSSHPNDVPIYPVESRLTNSTYALSIYINGDIIDQDGEIIEEYEHSKYESIGEIPVMVGSNYDNVVIDERKGNRKIDRGECENDPGGYFIIDGTERIYTQREDPRMNRIFINPDKKSGLPFATMNYESPLSRSRVDMYFTKQGFIHVKTNMQKFSEKDGGLNIFRCFRLLKTSLEWKYPGIMDDDDVFSKDWVIQEIKKMTRPEWASKVINSMSATIFNYIETIDDIEVLNANRGIKSIDESTSKNRKKLEEHVYNFMLYELFQHMTPFVPEDDKLSKNGLLDVTVKKGKLLVLILTQLLEVNVGLRDINDRDSWSNKRIITSGKAIEDLFKIMWAMIVKSTSHDINKNYNNSVKLRKSRTVEYEPEINNIISMIGSKSKDFITSSYKQSFSSGNWGIHSSSKVTIDNKKIYSKKDEGATEMLLREYSSLAVISALMMIKVPSKGRTKSGMAYLHFSQIGYVGVSQTPEGERCGLNKAKAVTCWISSNRSEDKINILLKDTVMEDMDEQYDTILIFNGKFMGWVQGENFYEFIISKRRSRQIGKDVAITHDTQSKILNIYNDSCRPTRPLLIVNPETQKLLIDEKNIWLDENGKMNDFNTLIRQGVIEYVDAWEQDSIYLADTISSIDFRQSQLKTADRNVEIAQDALERIIQGQSIYINSDNLENIDGDEIISIYDLTNDENPMGREMEEIKTDLKREISILESQKEELVSKRDEFVNKLNNFENTQNEEEDRVRDSIVKQIESHKRNRTVFKSNITDEINIIIGKLNVLIERMEILSPDLPFDEAKRLEYEASLEQELVLKRRMGDLKKKLALSDNNVAKIDDIIMKLENSIDASVASGIERLRSNIKREIKQYDVKIETIEMEIKNNNEKIANFEQISNISSSDESKARDTLKSAIKIRSELLSLMPYTHCELDPNAIHGTNTSVIPLPDHNQGPRNAYACNMLKQAVGIYSSAHSLRFDSSSKILAFPSRPIFETQMNRMVGLNDLPAGQTIIIAIMTYGGMTMEDAVILAKGAVDRGLFTMTVYNSYVSIAEAGETIKRPDIKNINSELLSALDENGIPVEGRIIKEGYYVIGKVKDEFVTDSRTGERIKKEIDVSEKAKLGESGKIDKVILSRNPSGKLTVKVKIRKVKRPESGDKVADRHAQKSTISQIKPSVDMPQIVSGPNAGLIPSMIFNPHAIPSRMTMGKLIEMIASKLGAFRGETQNATAFNNFDLSKIGELSRQLRQYGFNGGGMETMMNGMTGETFEAMIFSGPSYYQALRHKVSDKIQARALGKVDTATSQPLAGRNRGGGLRFGEMERDASISHGASNFLKERMSISSDASVHPLCRSCGHFAKIDESGFSCTTCRTDTEFVSCSLPGSHRYLTNLLAAGGIKVSVDIGAIGSNENDGDYSDDDVYEEEEEDEEDDVFEYDIDYESE